ncbi:MAG: hypothetical protein JXR73_00195 [Candidatus Omnitrophica bacterium]|nr:hypothetical protein [Candidatus Omnitrophota bacterium]
MDNAALLVANLMLCAAGLLSIVRIFIGPAPVDRAIGLEVFTLAGIALIATHGMQTNVEFYYDLLILWALLAFASTSALGLYLKRSKLR